MIPFKSPLRSGSTITGVHFNHLCNEGMPMPTLCATGFCACSYFSQYSGGKKVFDELIGLTLRNLIVKSENEPMPNLLGVGLIVTKTNCCQDKVDSVRG